MAHRLTLLGGLGLTADDGRDTPGIRRRGLALLAILATAGREGLSREKILLYLWPDSTPQRARNSLNQALLAIRRRLGEEAVEGKTELRLNPLRFQCDLWLLRSELDRKRPEEALRSYGGEFLEGFTLPGVDEFEAWVEAERGHVRRQVVDAAHTLVESARAAGDAASAADWLGRVAQLEPLSATAALEWMRALADAGDQARAVAVAREYAQHVRRELAMEPEPEVMELASHLADELALEGVGNDARAAHAANGIANRLAGNGDGHDGDRAAAKGAWGGVAPYSAYGLSTAKDFATGGGRRRIAATGVVLLVVVASFVAALTSRRSPAAPVDRGVTVLVFPFAEHSVLGQSFGRGMSELLAGDLDGVAGIHAIGGEAGLAATAPPGVAWSQATRAAELEAARADARLFVVGNVIGTGDTVRVEVLLFDRSQRSARLIARLGAQSATPAALRMADSLALQILVKVAPSIAGLGLRGSDLGTTSLLAMRGYLDGEAALNDDRYGAAIAAFRRATEADTAFALAYYRLSVAADWAGHPRLSEDAADRAAALAPRLPEEARYMLEGLRAWRAGDLETAERLYRRATEERPDDAEAWFGLADVLFRGGPLRGHPVTEARPAFEHVLAIDSGDIESLIHLARIAAIEGRSEQADSLVRRARDLTADSGAVELRAFRAFALSDAPGMKRATRDLVSHPGDVDAPTALRVAIYLDDLDGTDAFARKLMEPGRSVDTRAFGERLVAQAALARGRLGAASLLLRQSAAMDSVPALELNTLYAAFPLFGADRAALLRARDAARAWSPADDAVETVHNQSHAGLHPAIRLHRIGALSARLGDVAAADAAIDSLLALPGDGRTRDIARTLAWSVRAWLARERGQRTEVLAALDSARWPAAATALAEEASDRFLRAEALTADGAYLSALGWYASMAQRATYELPYRAPAELRQAQILDLLGNRRAAAVHFRRFLALWQNADPALQPIVRQARARLVAIGGAGASATPARPRSRSWWRLPFSSGSATSSDLPSPRRPTSAPVSR